MNPAPLVMSVLGVLLLTQCGTPEGVSVPPGSEELSMCAVRTIPVEQLAAEGEPGCNLEGSFIRVDSQLLEIQAVGIGAGQGDGLSVHYSFNNYGVPGVGVTKFVNDELIQIWASTEQARELQAELARQSMKNRKKR